ncbi:MAG: hypothetical protein H7320_04665 [Ferruginibacter sp.]|nr:hypothetical protein [Ferruginibacter sp.]
MKKIIVVFLSVISFSSFSQTPGGKIVVKKGQHFVVESSTDGTVKQEMMGQSMEMKISSATKLSAEIKDSKDNKYTITQMVTAMKSSFSGMGQEKTFDSDKKEDMDGEAGAVYKDKFNVPKDVIITNEGKSIAGADTTKKNSKPDDNPMAAIMDLMGGGQDNVTTVLFLVIPGGKKAGDTWQDSSVNEGVKMKRTYTLNAIANKEAAVSINAVVDINKTMQVQGMDMNAVMTSKIISTVLVDVLSNIQKENKSTMEIIGTIDVMGQSVPITAKGSSLTSVKAM